MTTVGKDVEPTRATPPRLLSREWAMPADLRVVLVGGSSHVGKSTLADSLAAKLGWRRISTDNLARHPGRPWKLEPEQVPDHVAQHYLSLSIRELIADVLHHYEINVWPQVATIATLTATDTATPRIVVEGSALWPSLVATLDIPGVAAAWLTASNAVFEQRILASSQYRTKSPRGKMMVGKFLKRTIVYNQKMMDQVRRYGLASIDVDGASVCELSQRCLSLLGLERYCL